MKNCYSSKDLMEEIKWRIKTNYKSQENFAKVFGGTRKTVNRLLNGNKDWDAIIRMCKLLGITGILLTE